MAVRLLLPSLPPELRDLIYAQTISNSAHAATNGLPFTRKIYDSSHTRVEIMPVHYGNAGLLALQRYRYLEGDEYANWTLANAVQLRITVLFKGHVNTFVQEHWDKKIATHLKNLAKRYPWLRKVADYDVKILWRPCSWAPSKKKRRAGAIAKRMVEVLTQEMDAHVRAKRGNVHAGLYVAKWVVGDLGVRGQALGLGEFVWDVEEGFAKTQVREMGIAVGDEESGRPETCGYLPSHFKAIPGITTATNKEHRFKSVCRRKLQQDQEDDVVFEGGDDDDDDVEPSTQRAMLATAEEISGFGQANAHVQTQR
ncbi:hypothetical protein BU23DRAFT_554576 [Bimuria novae-zelandiae CBS 107.79]|uniref:Uncharacterized protein n=1 Tax=Bimuria novae-zelandiae CBS 107.79 TaxID=1447943 RepID=A0A6A5V6G9_9PLEO|nr:hypothetical protein BU23DRAFT_554576 [Bimuria novae-zelandiae CBS 107.79]